MEAITTKIIKDDNKCFRQYGWTYPLAGQFPDNIVMDLNFKSTTTLEEILSIVDELNVYKTDEFFTKYKLSFTRIIHDDKKNEVEKMELDYQQLTRELKEIYNKFNGRYLSGRLIIPELNIPEEYYQTSLILKDDLNIKIFCNKGEPFYEYCISNDIFKKFYQSKN